MDEEAAKTLAEIIHDLNTPLAAIRSGTDTMEAAIGKLQKDGADAEIVTILRDALRTNRIACDRMTNLVKTVHTTSEVDLHHCLDSTLDVMAHDFQPCITVTKDYGIIRTVDGDANALSQVLMNLLVNAVHAISGKGEIRIRTWQDGKTVRIAISDTGRGIPLENQSRIFERGFTTKPDSKHCGLGLAICKKIIENHKGLIEFQSEVGRGTTFTIVLPERKTR